jgi:peptidoglycan pentaglycine glycine transferase (the first glycine)
MKAKILNKGEEAEWLKFAQSHPLGSIHQSPCWGHFQAAVPSRGKYWIIALYDNGQIVGGTVLIRHSVKGYSWLYAARGPLIDYRHPKEQLAALLDAIEPIAKEEKAVFLRIDPPLATTPKLPNFHPVIHGFQPEHTLIIDIEQSEPAILKQMKPKGRYNIKLAHKKGVAVQRINPKNAEELQLGAKAFYDLMAETTRRDGFHSHNEEYYHNMISNLHCQDQAALYIASYQHEAIAATIVTYFKDTATYYYGASSNEHRNLMAPYALHWKAIQDARSKGYTKYDMFGVAPAHEKHHPWAGITQFKSKFGGEYHEYAPAQEHTYKKLLHSIYKFRKK